MVPLLALLLLAAACTGDGNDVLEEPFPTPSGKMAPRVTLTLVASLADGAHAEYVEAIRLAVAEVNSGPVEIALDLRVLDHRGDAALAGESVVEAARSSAAVVYAGPGEVLTSVRSELEPTGVPVFLLEGDLYTTRGLYTNVFQASIPLLWQARVIARYLRVRQQEPSRVIHSAAEPEASRAAWESAAAEEGVSTAEEEADAPVVTLGEDDPSVESRLAGTDDLLGDADAPGTAAVAPYTWSGWAEPIPRVERFREAFRDAFGRIPMGREQQAYDSVRLLAVCLADTRGEGGRALIDRLERVTDRAFSSLPIRLGPDDHTLLDDFSIGMFAVAGPGEEVEPWMEGVTPWRPVMRSFTYDGERVTILERDRGPFFPKWRKPAPTPKYFRSELGIVTGPGDPLH